MAERSWVDTEFFRPLVNGWISKADAAYKTEARRRFREEADEAKIFYARSCAALWSSRYASKMLSGAIRRPKFPVSINKTFEAIAVMVPNILWSIPHRQCRPKRMADIPAEAQQILMADPQMAQSLQMLGQVDQQDLSKAQVVASLMELWLNYSAREVPDGGLEMHSHLATIDAFLTGRGVQFVRTYRYPGSNLTLTGLFREDPLDVLIDPDVKVIQNAKWLMLRHQDYYWDLEKRWDLAADSLKNKATLESAWAHGEMNQPESTSGFAPRGAESSDVVVWYEVWSKMGAGCRMLSAMEPGLRKHLQEVVGDYAYLAWTPNVPWPLNCPPERLRRGMRDEQVREAFQWPIPTWAANKWPCDFNDFYPDPDSVYPIAPMAAGMGHLKFINILMPYLFEATYEGLRKFWVVADSDIEHYRKFLESGAHNTIIPVKNAAAYDNDVKKVINILEQGELNFDGYRVLELASEWFALASGLTPMQYGMKGSESNDRSAEETRARARQAGVRIEWMQKSIASHQSRLASLEAFGARWYVRGNDIVPLAGQTGKFLWDSFVTTSNVELLIREMEYTVDASSLSRPDKEGDADKWLQALQILGPAYQEFALATGDFTGWNELVQAWGESIQMENPERLMMAPPQPDPAQQQAEQQAAQLEQAKAEAEIQGKQMDLQGKQLEIEAKAAEAEIDQQSKIAELLFNQERSRIELETAQRKAEIDLAQRSQAMQMEAEKQQMGIATQAISSAVKLGTQQQQSAEQIRAARQKARMQPKRPTARKPAR